MSGERNGDAIAVDDGGSSGGYARPSGKRSNRSNRREGRGHSRYAATATLTRSRQPRVSVSEPRQRLNPGKRVVGFFREVVIELRKVIWPSRRQMVGYTAVVLVFVAVMVALIYGLDFGFVKGVDGLFG